MLKIVIDAGHGLYTAGKRCLKSIDPNETREWILNSRIAEKVIEKLKSYSGYELLRVDDPTGKTDVALKTRTDKANKWKADFHLAIYHNTGIHGGTGGGMLSRNVILNIVCSLRGLSKTFTSKDYAIDDAIKDENKKFIY